MQYVCRHESLFTYLCMYVCIFALTYPPTPACKKHQAVRLIPLRVPSYPLERVSCAIGSFTFVYIG